MALLLAKLAGSGEGRGCKPRRVGRASQASYAHLRHHMRITGIICAHPLHWSVSTPAHCPMRRPAWGGEWVRWGRGGGGGACQGGRGTDAMRGRRRGALRLAVRQGSARQGGARAAWQAPCAGSSNAPRLPEDQCRGGGGPAGAEGAELGQSAQVQRCAARQASRGPASPRQQPKQARSLLRWQEPPRPPPTRHTRLPPFPVHYGHQDPPPPPTSSSGWRARDSMVAGGTL